MENQEEIWKNVIGYEGYYKVSNLGNVKSLKGYLVTKAGVVKPRHEKIMSQTIKDNGYKTIMLTVDNIRKRFYVHRLVAIAFIKNPKKKSEVNHLNCIKTDNRVCNLEWNTSNENKNHAKKNNLIKNGERHYASKLTENKVLAIIRLHKINPKFNRLNLAKKLGVRDTTIHKVIVGKNWKNLTQTNPELSKEYQYSKISGIKKSEL